MKKNVDLLFPRKMKCIYMEHVELCLGHVKVNFMNNRRKGITHNITCVTNMEIATKKFFKYAKKPIKFITKQA